MTTTLEEYDIMEFGDHIGKCLCDHTIKHMWINIPKNGSNTVSGHLLDMRWEDDNWNTHPEIKDYRSTVVVRDPLRRWKGSAIELSYHYLEHNRWSFEGFDEWFVERDFSNFERSMDIHFLKQTDFLINLNIADLIFIPMDVDFNSRVQKEFGITQGIREQNITRENELKVQITPYVNRLLENNQLVEKIKHFYRQDYALLDQLNINQPLL